MDREEGVPPSKTSPCEEHESQSKAQRTNMETPVKQQLLGTLEDMGDKELKLLHWYLQNPELLDGFSAIKKSRLQHADRPDTVDLMVDTYTPKHAMEVMSLILKKMKKNDNQSDETFPKEQKDLSKLIPNSEDETDQDKHIYPVTKESIQKRVALLINNMHYHGGFLATRKGSEKDEQAMQNLLTDLGYEVVTYRDLSVQEMDDALIQFCEHPKLKHTDSVFVVVLSHGEMGIIYGSDSGSYHIDRLYEHLSTKNCPSLVNKPKIIILSACRGDDRGLVDLRGETQSMPLEDTTVSDSPMFAGKVKIARNTLAHKEKDFISLLASTPNTVSWRNTQTGSYLILYLVEVFHTWAYKDDIEELFRKVMQRFEDCPTTRMQMPTKERCTLTKRFYLFPGNASQFVLKSMSTDASLTADFRCQLKIKSKLIKKFQCVFEGIARAGNPTLLNKIFTELYITEGETEEVSGEHEVIQIEASRKALNTDKRISCEDIFKLPPGRDEPIRTVMTKGVAGIGKTVLTQKFTLDWAENKANHGIKFLFPFSFKELNMLKDEKFSLVELVHHFFIETKEAGICSFEEFQVVFIFDGLDECRPTLNFNNTKIITDPTQPTSVDVLFTNLVRRNLLPSAHLWITTRPAAANQIPPDCVDMMTEVRGFTNPQKEEYFRKRFRNEEQAKKIISHIKKSRSLHIMCHIPVFCWITATVLEKVLKTREGGELPKTLTEMYIHFLVVQFKLKKVKYDGGAETDPHWSPESRKMIEDLGKLAFDQLQKGNQIFYESELTECGIDITAASVYSGVFTQNFKEESGLYQEEVFSFIHLSVQEFLAALHVHLTFINSGDNLLEKGKQPTSQNLKPRNAVNFYQSAVNKALQSPNGHLDLFLRFLLGLSLQTNQRLLRGLLTQTGSSSQTNQETVQYIKKKIKKHLSAEKSINLFHCLNELNDRSLEEEIQQYLRSGSLSTDELSPAQWSALVFILLSSEQDLDVFDLKKYSASEEALLRLLPVVKASNKAVLSNCNLSIRSCEALSSVLSSQSCKLRDLDLSNNNLKDSGVKKLCGGLESSFCKLEILRLSGCLITEEGCASLALALNSNPSHLKELDLSYNHPGVSVKQLSGYVEDPKWKLNTLRVEPAGERWLTPGLRKYCSELTVDTKTVNKNIKLSDNKKEVTYVKEVQSYPQDPDRFHMCRQLLCTESLTGRCYWEVEVRGGAEITVSYGGISRRGGFSDCVFGWNDQSWSLNCDDDHYSVWHNYEETPISLSSSSSSSSVSNRVAVYVDYPAGTLSFYRVSSDSLTHLYTFNTTFTQPLHPGFGFGYWSSSGSSVSLCSVGRNTQIADS